jgi:hypothetical protein
MEGLMVSEAGKRLDRMLFKQLGFTMGNRGFRKVELPEFVALLDENRDIWLLSEKEGIPAEDCIAYWEKARFSLLRLLLASYLPKEICEEVDHELHADMVKFITEIDRKKQ